MAVAVVRQYSVFLPNRPGALSEYARLFADNNLNILGIASEIRDDSGVVRVSLEGDKRLGYILTKAGFTTIEAPMLSVDLVDRPGELFRIAKILGDAGINITTLYGTALNGQKSRLLMAVSDIKKAQEVLSSYPEYQ